MKKEGHPFSEKPFSDNGTRLGLISFPVLLRRDAFVLFKGFDKIAQIVESAGKARLGDRAAADPKHPAGTVDTVHIEIINRAALGISFKKAAEISGVHSGDLCQLLKGNGVGIILFYPAENRLHFCVTRKMPADRRLSGHGTVAVKQL